MGVRGVDLAGSERDMRAPAVILACGGAGAIYAKHDNQASIMGQGYYLAACAGLDLWDMEFVQCYPIVLDEPDMPMMMIYPPYPQEATLIGPRERISSRSTTWAISTRPSSGNVMPSPPC